MYVLHLVLNLLHETGPWLFTGQSCMYTSDLSFMLFIPEPYTTRLVCWDILIRKQLDDIFCLPVQWEEHL